MKSVYLWPDVFFSNKLMCKIAVRSRFNWINSDCQRGAAMNDDLYQNNVLVCFGPRTAFLLADVG